jgi:transcriptional antiterminator RfaH
MTRLASPEPCPAGAVEGSPGWAWFCIRSQQKHEQIAANCLRQTGDVEVFFPRLRYIQPRRYGKVWITEPLFPGYLFARFSWQDSLCKVHYSAGVQSVVHFGNGWPTVPDHVIAELRAAAGKDELQIIPEQVTPGDEVEILGGLFRGVQTVVTQVMPGRNRVAVLLDFLGRQTAVEMSAQSIIKWGARR